MGLGRRGRNGIAINRSHHEIDEEMNCHRIEDILHSDIHSREKYAHAKRLRDLQHGAEDRLRLQVNQVTGGKEQTAEQQWYPEPRLLALWTIHGVIYNAEDARTIHQFLRHRPAQTNMAVVAGTG